MEKEKNSKHGLKWGLIISAVYLVFLFMRYKVGASEPLMFSAIAVIGYPIVLILLFIAGNTRKKELGGFIELRDAFQTMFVAVVIFEFVYSLFNFIYLKYIDPEFFQRFSAATEEYLSKMGMKQSDIDRKLQDLDEASGRKMTGGSLFILYLQNLAISGVFALIFALIIKKRKDPFQNQQDTFLQS
jgi:hypothetical protein